MEGNEDFLGGPKKPEFNAAFAYLYRLDGMVRQAEIFMIQNSFREAYVTLRLLHSEIVARAIKSDNKKVITTMNEKLRVLKTTQSKGLPPALVSESLYEWFDEINHASHELGLIMPDKNDFLGGADIV